MTQDWTQDALDKWIGIDAEAHQALRSGRVPKMVAEGGAKVVGCLSVFAALLGAAAGAGFGFNTYARFGDSTGLSRGEFALACAAFFAVALVVLFRRKWSKLGGLNDLTSAPVRSELLELQVERSDGQRTFLKAEDGRRFLVTRPAPAAFSGRFRIYFVDIAKVGGMAATEGGVPDLFVLGIELP